MRRKRTQSYTNLRLREPDETMFKKNGKKGNHACRKPGAKNRYPLEVKHAILESLHSIGDYYQWYVDCVNAGKRPSRSQRIRKLYGMGGMIAALNRMQRKEPTGYMALIARTLPYQVSGKLDASINHKLETPNDVLAALRERGLPPPQDIIDITPEDFAVTSKAGAGK